MLGFQQLTLGLEFILIYNYLLVLLLNIAEVDMSSKVRKLSQSNSFSDQIRSSSHGKTIKNQSTQGFFKELPPLNRFQAAKNPSQLSNTFSKRVKTQELAQSRREISPSDKQISRFIYKHLIKRIAFQQKIYGDLETNSNNKSTPEKIDSLDAASRRSTLAFIAGANKMKQHVYAYQKTQSPEHHQSQIKKPLTNLKQRMHKNQYLRSNMLNMSLAKRRYKKQTHIDAYFDLSCLERIKQTQDKQFLLTNL